MTRLGKSAATLLLAVSLVGGFEGLRTVAYLDPVGVPTVCFGHTRNVALGVEYTRAECEALLVDTLLEHERGMRGCLQEPDDLPHETYVAFLSFTYNVGVEAFCRSTLRKKADAGDLHGACDELPKWNRAGGVPWPGLTRRRMEERALCLRSLPLRPQGTA